jgi:chromosome segregation ATPase
MDRAGGTAPGGGAASPDRPGHQIAEREQRLQEREHQADERERQADEREREADEREERLQERAARLRQHSVELRARMISTREQADQAVEQSKAVLDASENRVRRAEAMLKRAYARDARERANLARSIQLCEQHPVHRPVDVTVLAGRVSALRERTAAAAAQLAKSEELVARVHDELAARDPGNPDYKRLARQAREAARWARETERRFTEPDACEEERT